MTWLAADRHVAINTQKIALNALVYLYHKVLGVELGDLGFTLANKQRHLPTVLSVDEIRKILSHLHGSNRLIIKILYGSGLRINECLRLRVQDIDFALMSIMVHDGKGRKDRTTLLSASVVEDLKSQIESAIHNAVGQRQQQFHAAAMAGGFVLWLNDGLTDLFDHTLARLCMKSAIMKPESPVRVLPTVIF